MEIGAKCFSITGVITISKLVMVSVKKCNSKNVNFNRTAIVESIFHDLDEGCWLPDRLLSMFSVLTSVLYQKRKTKNNTPKFPHNHIFFYPRWLPIYHQLYISLRNSYDEDIRFIENDFKIKTPKYISITVKSN